MTTAGLTRRQTDLLDFIVGYIAREGIAPSYEEMLVGIGVKSKSRIHGMMVALQERGYITFLKARPRSLVVINLQHNKKAKVQIRISRRGYFIEAVPVGNVEVIIETWP